MADAFDTMAEDYRSLAGGISKKISSLSAKDGNRSEICSDLDSQFKEANDSLKTMEVQVRTLDPKSKSRCQQVLAQFKNDLQTLRKDFDRMKEDVNRDSLFDVSRDGNSQSAEQRARLLAAVDKEANGTQRLKDAHRQLVDAEAEGAATMVDLRRQRDIILKVNDNLDEADGLYGKVKNVIARMSRREIYMALLWVFIGIMLIVAIVLIIYYKFVKKGDSASQT